MDSDLTGRPQVIDIFLSPGDFYFGDASTRIRTLLGSCVAITLWHPQRRIGGMCHFILPTRARRHEPGDIDGRYGDEAMVLFMREVRLARSRPGDYRVQVFGGGNMFPHLRKDGGTDVGRRNVEHALELLGRHGFAVAGRHVEGVGHRNLIFDVGSGDVWLRHTDVSGE